MGYFGNIGKGGTLVSIGTTGERTALEGNIRINTTTGLFEYYVSGSWNPIPLGGGGVTVITNTLNVDFGVENDIKITTIANINLTNSNIKSFTYFPISTTNTSLDDFTLNGVSFNIENIVDNTSFDIRGSALNNASGIYQIKYIILY